MATIAAAFGAASIWLASRPPALAINAISTPAAVVSLVAGWSLIATGIWSWWRSSNAVALLTIAAGVAWFTAGWANPGTGSPLVFTAGLLVGALTQAFVAHLVISYPDGRVNGMRARSVVGAGYLIGFVGMGVMPTLLVIPRAAGCHQCPTNLLAIASAPALASGLLSASLVASAAVALMAAYLALRAVIHSTPPARLVRAPVVAAGIVYLAAFAARAIHDAQAGAFGLDEVDATAWIVEAVALIGLSLGIASRWARARRTRGRIAALVVDLARAARPGGMRAALADLLTDPELVLAYPIGDGRFVDATGTTVVPSTRPARRTTPLIRGGEAIALLDHSASLTDDPVQFNEVVEAAYLAIENERLTALARARLESVRQTRRRVVAARDAERRRIERDLHDGAQQRLVALMIGLRLLRRPAKTGAAATDDGALIAAERETGEAIAALREIGHGIYPSLLAEEGIAAAVAALVEDSQATFELVSVAEGRCDRAVESAAYDLIAELPIAAGATRVTVRVECQAGSLLVRVDHDGDRATDLTALSERIAALGGTLSHHERPPDLVVLEAELPCAS